MTSGSTVSPPPEERILSTVGNLTRATGFMGAKQKTYSLVITDRRLIFAELTREKMKETWKKAGADAKSQGKGPLSRWGAQTQTFDDCHERYRDMPPDTALAETPGNFAIDRDLIKKVKFKTGAGTVGNPESDLDQMIIKTSAEKIKLLVLHSLLAHVKETFRAAGIS